MRILGLDYGDRRIGVAICDELGMIAQGIPTIIRKNRDADLAAIAGCVERLGVEKIVIGYPLRLDGSEGIQCDKVNRFARRMEARLSIPVILRDESFSTKEAEELLRESGVRREKKRAVVDRLAACIILQGYLDALPHKGGNGRMPR